jgi:flagellar hook-associated protein 2
MSTIQFGGVVSGLNTQSIVSALVAAESQPLTAMQAQEATLTSQKSAYGQLGTAIDSVVSAIKNFTVTNAGASRLATSSDNSVFTATASPSASVSQYQIAVSQLATATVATSIGALGSAVTGDVDTSQMIANTVLAGPVKAGTMTFTVDGQAVSVAVGNPTTTTLQSVMNSISGAIQTQLQATDSGATVNASVVNGQLQLSVAGSVNHTIAFDTGDTSGLAAALGLGSAQNVTDVQNATISGTSTLYPTLQSLNLPGTVGAGTISAVVDGVIVHYTVGDPSQTSLNQLMQGFGQAIQNQLRSGGNGHDADAGATATFSVVGNRLQLTIAGANDPHALSFGASSDTSNALGMLGIDNASATDTSKTPTLTGDTNLGVTRMLSALNASGIAGLTTATTGTLTIDGVAISYDARVDSLSTIISRINNSSAGVIASIDRTDDKIVLTKQNTGAVAIDIADTGPLAGALGLAPGTTNSQQIGHSAQLTVNGKSVTSTSNTVMNAIDGVTLNLLGQTPAGQTSETLSVGVDSSGVQTALNTFISAFNSLGNTLDQLTANTPGQAGGTAGTTGPLGDDSTALTMFLNLRATVFQTYGSGSTNSLGAIGVNTGAVGSAVGTTSRLQLDTTQLTSALTGDPNAVSNLLDSTTGPFGALLTQLQGYEDPSNSSAYVQSNQTSLTTEISDLQTREANEQEIINNYQTMIEAQFTAMETTLATLQSQSAQIAAEMGYSTSSSSSSSSSSGLTSTTSSSS